MDKEETYKAYAPLLYGMILRLTDEKKIAERILEKSFIRIYGTLPVYDESQCRLFTWMMRITLAECMTALHISVTTLKTGTGIGHTMTAMHDEYASTLAGNISYKAYVKNLKQHEQ